jgi:hypothetical protein
VQLLSRRVACFAKNFAGQKIQWSQTLDVSEQGFSGLMISLWSRLNRRAANARKKSLLLFSEISNRTKDLEKS